MKTNIMKKLTLFAVAFAFCSVLFAKPMDVKAALTAPTNLRQTDAITNSYSCSIKAEWDDTSEGTYCVEYSLDQVTWTVKSASTSYNYEIFTNFVPGRTYYIKVTPIENGQKGAPAVITADTAPRNTSITTQTGADPSGRNVTFAWQPSDGATGYAIYIGTSDSVSNASPLTTTTATSYALSVPKNSVFYAFVIPYRGEWLSSTYAYSMIVSAPSAPSKAWVYRTNTTDKEVTFYYQAASYSENTSGYDFEIYTVKNKNGKTKKLKSININNKNTLETTVKSSKLFSAGYKFRVRAYVMINGVKCPGEWSNFYTYVPCAKIKGSLGNRTNSSATLSWNKVLGATSYTVYHKTSLYGKWKAVKKNVKGTSATVKYSKSSTYNYYCVKANKVKIDKKKYNSPNPNSNNAYSYSEFKKKYYYY